MIPDTETTRLLRTINVLPEQILELAELPIEVVKTAIADGRAREGVRDLAGWVVKLLRTHRDYGWKINPPVPHPESPDALRTAFARYAAQQETEPCVKLPDDTPSFRPFPPTILNQPDMLTQLWNEVQAAMQLQTTRSEFNTWIRPTVLHTVVQGEATIMVPNVLAKERIENRFIAALRDLLVLHVGEPIRVRVLLNGVEQIEEIFSSPTALQSPDLAPTAAPTMSTVDLEGRPDWISLDRWQGLPAMMRAALRGSTLTDGEVQAKTTYMSDLLRLRHSHALAELIAEARSSTPGLDYQAVAPGA